MDSKRPVAPGASPAPPPPEQSPGGATSCFPSQAGAAALRVDTREPWGTLQLNMYLAIKHRDAHLPFRWKGWWLS